METKPILINCGSGRTNFGPEWIHVDAVNYNHIQDNDVFLHRWPENSVDLIYSSHMLEYFSVRDAKFLLQCWYGALKPNGIVRLAVPNFDALIAVYNRSSNFKDIVGPLYGELSMNDNYVYHKTCYTHETLGQLLIDVGFKNVQSWDYRINPVDDAAAAHWPHRPENIKNRKFDDDQILVSLNLEAFK